MSSLTRKSNTLTGWAFLAETAGGGVGASGGGSTIATALSVSGASSTKALRGTTEEVEILTDFLACLEGFSL